MKRQRSTEQGLRRLVAGSLVAMLSGGLLMLPGAAGAQEVEGETPAAGNPADGLGGYDSESSGAPLAILLFEPVTPVPVDPGEPHLRADHAYVLTRIATGPEGRALASSLWPGPLVGDGFNLITGQGEYPLKTDLTSPGAETEARSEAPGGAGMYSFAEGFDILARAQAGESPGGAELAFGNFDSESRSQVIEGVAQSTITTVAQDVSILGGVITIDSVETTVTTSSDGTTGATLGLTTVSGLTIAGQGYVVDENGVQPADGASVSGPLAVPGNAELAETLGITVRLTRHEETLNGPRAGRTAGGLVISVDMDILRSQIDTSPVEEVLAGLPDIPDPGVPPEVRDELPVNPFGSPYLTLLPAFLLSPEVVYVFGNAESETVATEPIEFAPIAPLPPVAAAPAPAAAPQPAASPAAVAATSSAPPTSTITRQGTTSPVISTSPTTTNVIAPAVAVAPPAVAAAAPLSAPGPLLLGIADVTGVPAILALLGLAGAIAGAWGLRQLPVVLLGLADACTRGLPTDLPTLTRGA